MNSLVKQDDELSWQAFRYVAGEMTAAEVASFEACMLEDSDVCEAVARVALVCENAYQAFDSLPLIPHSMPAVRSSAARRFGARATVVAVAGVVTLAALLTHQVSSRLQNDNVEVARLWTDSAADSMSSASLDEAEGNLPESVQTHDLDVPEWMLAAVRLEASGDDEVMDN